MSCSRTQYSDEPTTPRSRVKHSTTALLQPCGYSSFSPASLIEQVNEGPFGNSSFVGFVENENLKVKNLFFFLYSKHS